ncbi:MAG: FAD-dependent oxidoreductase [Smithellaceae bacterium]
MSNELESLFQPFSIGSLTLKNRIVFPAILLVPKQDTISFLSPRAKGGAGLVMVPGGMLMRTAPADYFHLYSDNAIPELTEIAQALHAQGAKIGIQLHHQGRQIHDASVPVAPSPIPWSANSPVPRELERDEINDLIEEFSDAVRRARDAGLDMAEIHGAHGYLVNQFLSARSNQRKDDYGGDVQNRARFLVEIIRRAREKVGDAFPISCRINAADYIEGGLTVEDAVLIARLAEQAGASLINISAGVYGYPVTIAPMYSPRALNVEFAGQIKAAVKTPVCVVGRIDTPQLAAQILQDGKADLIAMGRPLLVDPELPNKARRGELDRIRPCIYCNNGCMAHMEGRSAMSNCTVNPLMGKEATLEITGAKKIKKVLVIGGGLAGLEAARIASLRGHKVILYEKENALGGQWLLAAIPPFKETLRPYLQWLINEVKLSGTILKLNKPFSMSDLEVENPDAVILATGALPTVPPVPGIETATTAWEVLQGKAQFGADVFIVGGNATGLEVAHLLAVQGKRVTVIEMTSRFGADMPATIRWHLRKLLDEHGVRLKSSVKLKQIGPDKSVTVETKKGEETWSGFSDVILATGMRSQNEFKTSLEAVVREVHVIGDAKQPRSGLDAIAEGAQTGSNL